MGSTNKTQYLELPQWIGTDQPTWLGDMNDAFLKIDNGYNDVNGDASSAISQAGQAVQAANNASSAAKAAQTAAESASAAANSATGTANSALKTANNAASSVTSLTSRITTVEDTVTTLSNWQAGSVTFASGFSGNSFLNLNSTLNLFGMAVSATTPSTIAATQKLFTLPEAFWPSSTRTIYGAITLFSAETGVSVVSDITISTSGVVARASTSPNSNMSHMRCNLMLCTAQW